MKKFLFFTLLFLALQTVAMEPEKPRRSIRIQKKELKKRKIDPQDLLHEGIQTADTQKIQRAIALHADINEPFDSLHFPVPLTMPCTPLMAAFGYKNYAKYFENKHQDSHFASNQQYNDVIQVLLTNNADPNKRLSSADKSPLCVALEENYEFDIVCSLLKHNADPNERARAYTPLSVALAKAPQYCKLLLEYGADPGDPDVRPIWAIINHGQNTAQVARLLRLLLENGAPTNMGALSTINSVTAAIFFGKTLLVKLLLEHGTDTQEGDRLPLSVAIESLQRITTTKEIEMQQYIIKLLLKHGAHTNVADPFIFKPLEIALILDDGSPSWGLTQELLLHGAFIPDNQTKIIYDLAQHNLHPLAFAAGFGTLQQLKDQCEIGMEQEQLDDALMWAAARATQSEGIDRVAYLLQKDAQPQKAVKKVVPILIQYSNHLTHPGNFCQYISVFHLLAQKLPDSQKSQNLLGKLMARTLKLKNPILIKPFISYSPSLTRSIEFVEKTLARPLDKDRAYFEKLRKFLTAQSLQETILQKGGAVAQTLRKNRNQLPENLQSRLERLQKNNKLIARRISSLN